MGRSPSALERAEVAQNYPRPHQLRGLWLALAALGLLKRYNLNSRAAQFRGAGDLGTGWGSRMDCCLIPVVNPPQISIFSQVAEAEESGQP